MTTGQGANRRLSVLLLIPARDEGGAERVAEDLVSALAGRCDFTAVLPAADGISALAGRLASHARVVRLPIERTDGLLASLPRIRSLARHSDVVHLSSTHPSSRLCAALALAVGRAAPLVSVEQQASPPSAVLLPPWFSPWASRAFRLSRRRAAVIVAVSDENARRLSGEYRIDPSRIVTVYNGVDLSLFDLPAQARSERRQELGIANDEQVVVVAARQAPNKGHRVLVEASSRILAERPRTRFVLAGARHPMVEELIRRQGVSESFLDLGFVSHPEMARTMAAADVLVLPSLAEGFSLALIEGMAAGAIPVATAVGGARELITEGVDGFLVPPLEAGPLSEAILSALALPPADRVAIVSRARRRAASFSIQRTADAMMELFRKVVRASHLPAGE